jgi:hypothetical protein
MENKGKNKNKKRLLILVALVGVMGIGGVVAATSISINSGVPISLGAGYTTATTCDTDVTITAGQAYDTGTNLYVVNALNVTNVNTTSGNCNNKTMQLAYVTTANAAVQASWSLPSSAAAFTFIFGTAANATTPRLIGTTQYSTATLTAFDIATLATVALSIS